MPPAFLPEVGQVEIISTARDPDAERGTKAAVNKRQVASAAQLEGRLIRQPGEGRKTVWYVEHGVKRRLESPTAGALRFGDSWNRLVQTLPTDEDAGIVPDGPPLTLAEAGEGRILGAWPAPETYLVQDGRKRRIDDDASIIDRYGAHWRVKSDASYRLPAVKRPSFLPPFGRRDLGRSRSPVQRTHAVSDRRSFAVSDG
jgi:hypothetical protein